MTPKPIRKLPTSLVNRIAAGEVIERPASVVKELVENAIDAGATAISIEIEDGGLSLIRITDNGYGIPPDQLPLALAEHATSKLLTDDDLFKISTKGFRGEALASIASVSHLRIVSRTADAQAAYEITSKGGEHSLPQAAAGNVGTVLEIRNLFFNTPARRKFMKGPPTEMGHISEMVLKLALPHPHVAFSVSHNGRAGLRLPATDSLTDRLLQAWPDEFREQRLPPLEARDAEVKITGVIGLPELAHPTAKYQYLYVNDRPIRDKTLSHALRESFRGLTEPGRHPAAVLLLHLPPEDVDVNVHPTKIEVRFKNSQRLYGLLLSSIRELLLSNDLTPKAQPRAIGPAASAEVSPALPPRENMIQQLVEFFKTPPETVPVLSASAEPLPVASAQAPQEKPTLLPAGEGGGTPPDEGERAKPGEAPTRRTDPPALSTGNGSAPALSTGTPFSPSLPALQLHNTYLVVETPEGLQIIDQHALHERVLFEELLTRLTRGPLESQHLLLPLTLRASERQQDLVDQIQPLLQKLGIDLTVTGPNQIAILAFPSFLHRLDPGEFVSALLDKGEQELLDLSQEELLHDVLDMMACKAAVKAGDPLTPKQIESLLAKRHLTDRASNCPHGRPTTLKLSLKDLEKQFKRTGF